MNKKSIARNSLAQIIMILTSVMIIFPLYFMTIKPPSQASATP